MARENVRRTIDGVEFEFLPLTPKVSLKVLTRLTKVLVEPLGMLGLNLAQGAGVAAIASILQTKLDAKVLQTALSALASRLDEDEVVVTVETLIGNTLMRAPGDKGTRAVVLDVDFAGRTLMLLKVVAAALEVNFADFFGASGGLLAVAPPAAT